MPPLVRTMGKEMSFDEFWKHYPRKISKKIAFTAWNKLSTAHQQLALEAIPKHAALWKQRGTEPQFIPHASSWLNGWRFEDEIEPASRMESCVKQAWWSSESAMLEKGRELGTQPRPGEDWQQFKGRLIQMMQRVA